MSDLEDGLQRLIETARLYCDTYEDDSCASVNEMDPRDWCGACRLLFIEIRPLLEKR